VNCENVKREKKKDRPSPGGLYFLSEPLIKLIK